MAINLEQLTKLELLHAQLEGREKALTTQEKNLSSAIKDLMAVLSVRAETDLFLKTLQDQINMATIGVFEKLLTAIVQDTLPHDPREVKMAITVKNDAPHLDIFVKDMFGNEEDILNDNGGALTNAICMGLRFATIVRTKSRKFLILDEPDCWVYPDLVPAFFNVIHRISEKVGIQTLIVTHMGKHCIPEGAAHIEVRTKDGNPVLDIIRAGKPSDSVAYLKLTNYKRHVSTTLPLFKGATYITGQSNTGKSALISGFRSLFRGITSESDINHAASSFELEAKVDNKVLKMVRKRKGSPVVKVSCEDLTTGEVESGSLESKNKLPDWFSSVLKMESMEDLDPHISHQKMPIYLLDKPGSMKSKLLTTGRESQYVSEMIDTYKKECRANEAQLKIYKADFDKVCLSLELFHNFEFQEYVRDHLKGLSKEIELGESLLKALTATISNLEALIGTQDLKLPDTLVPCNIISTEALAQHEGFIKVLNATKDLKLPEPCELLKISPECQNLKELEKSLTALKSVESLVLQNPLTALVLPHTSTELAGVLSQLEYLNSFSALQVPNVLTCELLQEVSKAAELRQVMSNLEVLPVKEVPALMPNLVLTSGKELELLEALESQLVNMGSLIQETALKLKDVDSQLLVLDMELSVAQDALGGVCPVCNQLIGEHQHD